MVALGQAVHDRVTDRLLAEDAGDRDRLGNAIDRFGQRAPGLAGQIGGERLDGRRGRGGGRPVGRAGDRGQQRDPPAAGCGDVDRLRQRPLGMTRAIDTHKEVVKGRIARIRDLALEAGIAPSTATRILDALERREIVSRTRAEHDRRGVTVTLTALGREALGRQEAWMRDRQRAFFAGLPASEQALAPDLLIRLAGLIDELAVGPC